MSPLIAFDIAVVAQKVKDVVNEDRCDLKKLGAGAGGSVVGRVGY